ncbi:MAG: cytochrome c family protein [Myxococcales bacterium]|nr:MAG: cytochrome c family protein [Myxococcales bacterium]
MSVAAVNDTKHWLRGGAGGPLLLVALVVVAVAFLFFYYLYPGLHRGYGDKIPFARAIFGGALEQPIPFSHRLHATDKEIACQYCHPYTERSMNAGLPTIGKCLGCHDHIIPEHEEILKLKVYREAGATLPWKRVYYNPDHVFFPHYRHIAKGVQCTECHGEIEQVDRLRQATFYMGMCINCHRRKNAPITCVACHQ